MIKSAIFLIFIFKHVKGNDTTCFQEETKLEGIKLELDGRYKYSFSVEKCQLLCEKTSNCTSWTFISGDFPECELFTEVQNVVTEQDNATSGPKSCVQNKEKKPTLEKPSSRLKDSVWIEPWAHTHWGNWGAIRICSVGHNVVGVQQRIEAPINGDDTALNAIRFTCSNGKTLISAEQYWGGWHGYQKSHSNDFVGIRLRTEPSLGRGDDTAANGIQLKNSWNWVYHPGDGYWGSWSQWVYCPTGKKIIGFQTRVEPSLGKGDDTALNNVRILCG